MRKNFTQINCNDFKRQLEKGDSILIDLRTQDEQCKYGIISENQIHIDVYHPLAGLKILQLNKSKKYLLYCWHGIRSDNIRNLMQKNHFKDVVDLKGGINAWNSKK